jgi:hypothetical protein
LADRLQEELTLTNEATEQSAEKLPPLPTEMLDQRSPAPERLEAGLRYARSLIDPRKGQRFIWGMGPMSISDPTGYLELLAQLPPRSEILPWMRGARIVARVPADFNLGESPLAKAKRVSVDPFVVPPNAHEEELLANAADPKMPVGERMQAEVQLADEWPSRHPLGSGLAIQQRKDVNLGHSLVHYEILTHSDGSLHELGHGAMGVTFKAIDELSGRGRGPTSQHRLASSSV